MPAPDEPTERRRPGRPATGHQPTRSLRIGDVWEEAQAVAAGRQESINQVVTRALENYVRRHRAEARQVRLGGTPP